MSFNLVSIAVLFIAAVIITFEVIRAISRGVKKAVITLVSIFISIFLAIIITLLASDAIIGAAIKLLDKLSGLNVLYDRFPHFKEVVFAYADAIISPILFVLLFLLVRLIVAITFAIIFRVRAKKNKDTAYENEDAPEYVKRPKWISAILGVVSGFLVSVILFMPVVGTLKIAATAAEKVNETSEAFNFKIKKSTVKALRSFSNDLVGNVFYYSGGVLVYKATSSSKLNGNHFELEPEIVHSLDGIDDLLNVGMIISDVGNITPEEKELLAGVGEKINQAETLRTVGADFIADLAKRWLVEDKYYNIPKPSVGNASEVFFDKMLYVCKSTTPDTVGADLSTLLNVYLLSDEYGILVTKDYKDLVETANRTGAFTQIKDELSKNSRMKGVSAEIDNMAVRAVASAVTNFSDEEYEVITTDVANTLNAAMKYREEERVEYITAYLEQHINERDIDVGQDITNEVAKKLADELMMDSSKVITNEDVERFWEEYTLTEAELEELS